MDTWKKIEESLKRAEQFLLEQVNTETPGVKRCSSYHDIQKYPDMCLPATYNSVHALLLLGAYQDTKNPECRQAAEFIRSFQTETGAFRFHHMTGEQIWKGKSLSYSWAYIDGHITNYCMGALKSLGEPLRYPLTFTEPFQEPEMLKKWLEERDMTDPWLEGNNIVNLASFLIYELEQKEDKRLKELMKLFFDWHEAHQDPETGFWGTNDPVCPAGIMEGMAGAAHNFHLYFYNNREIPYYKPIVDYCLEFIQGRVKSACLDVDVVDILANLMVFGYRSQEILERLESFAEQLIAFQNEDGGFADEKTNGVRRMDGWAGGYFEPQGLSNCFATWFRSATLAMIACVLEPQRANRFCFRNTIGIGYYNPQYLR